MPLMIVKGGCPWGVGVGGDLGLQGREADRDRLEEGAHLGGGGGGRGDSEDEKGWYSEDGLKDVAG